MKVKYFIKNRISYFFKAMWHDIKVFIYNHSKYIKFDCIFCDHLAQECYEKWCLEYSKSEKCYFCSHLKFKFNRR